MIQSLESRARDCWADWFPNDPAPKSLRSLIVGPFDDAPEKEMLFFLFKDKAARPHAVAKVARFPRAEPLVTHEYRFLKRVRTALPEEWKSSVPSPLGLERIEGRLVFLQSCLPGRHLEEDWPASASLRKRSEMEAVLDRLAEWWSVFRRATARPVEAETPEAGEGRPDRSDAKSIDEFVKAFDLEPDERRFLDHYRTHGTAQAVAGRALGAQHGDFCNLNVIVNDQRIGVIDWAFGEEARLPWTDLYTFASTFYLISGRGPRPSVEEAFDRSYIDDNWLSRLLGRWLSRCIAAESLSGEAMAQAVPMVFIENAMVGTRRYGKIRESDRSWQRRFGRLVSQWDRFRAAHDTMVRP